MQQVVATGFVGRVAELRLLDGWLDRASAGAGGLVRITGEPGIGKTALTRLLVDRARTRGFDVAWSTCRQVATVPGLWPWTQLLAQLATSHDSPPDLAAAGAPGDDPEAARHAQAERIVGWLRDRGGQPALLVLDDLHWADAGTLFVLAHIAATLPVMPLLVTATARPVTGGDTNAGTAAYAAALAPPQRLGDELALGGLDATDSAALVTATTGVTPSADAVRTIHVLTAGNPLFVQEVSRHLDGSQLTGRLDATGLELHRPVHDLIGDRLARCSDGCRRLLDGLAVAGDDAPLAVLADITGGETLAALDAVEEASRARLVEHDDSAGGSVRFAHALFRAAVYEHLSLSDRARWHDTIGRALLARREAGHPVDVAALAHHFGRSAPLGNGALAVAFALEAATDAGALLAYDVAARRLEQAVALVTADPSLGERLSILLDLADALAGAGDTDRARTTFAEAAAAARTAGDAAALGRAALGYSGGVAGMGTIVGDRAVCDLLTEAAALLDDDLVLGPLVEARLSTALSFLAPLSDRRALAARAGDRARSGGDPVTIIHVLAAQADVMAGPDDVEQRLALASEIVARSVDAGDARLETLGRRLRVEALLEHGDLGQAGAEVARYEPAAGRLGRADYSWYPSLWRAALAFARGDIAAWRRHRDDLDAAAAAGGFNAELLAGVHEAMTALDLGDRMALPGLLDRVVALDVPLDAVQFRCTLALFRALASGGRETGEPVGPLVAEALTADPDSEWLPMMAQLAELTALTGAIEEAEMLREVLAPHAAVWVIEGIGACIRGPAHRQLGRLAAAVGDVEAARGHFDAARAATEAAGASLLTALVDREQGVALGEPDLVAAADAALHVMGATPATEPENAGPPSLGAGRFVLAGESWTISYAGTTVHLRDSKGLRDLARLIATPGRAIAALDLVAPGPTVSEGATGEILDAQARAAYRARLEELRSELDEADADGDAERSARLAAEHDALVEQLTGAYGLGGRARTTSGSAERARTAVRARIRDALDRIEAANPALGRHLGRSVRTGTFCTYEPDDPIDWEL